MGQIELIMQKIIRYKVMAWLPFQKGDVKSLFVLVSVYVNKYERDKTTDI